MTTSPLRRSAWPALGILLIATAVQLRRATPTLTAWREDLPAADASQTRLTLEEYEGSRTVHLLHHRFPFHGDEWRFVENEVSPSPTPPAWTGERGKEGERTYWGFDRFQAAMALALEVDGGQLLAVELQVRVAADAVQDPEVPRQGVLGILPLKQPVDLETRLATTGLMDLWGAEACLGRPRLALVPTAGDGEWQTLRGAFEVPVDARTVLLVFSTGDGTSVVDLASLAIRQLPLRELCVPDPDAPLPRLDLPPNASPVADQGILWLDQEHSLARIHCLDETREGVVLPSPGTWTTQVQLPDGDLNLEFGVARLYEARTLWRQRRIDFQVQVRDGDDTRTLLDTALEPSDPTGWVDQCVDLSAHAGRTVELVFRASSNYSEDLLALGSPMVRRRDTARTRPNVVLVSLDTVRADHLGVSGHPRPTTPNLDELARRNHWFRNAFSTSSYTLPSHASMMTGQLPSLHGAISETPGRNRLSRARSEILAVRLREAGYHTAAFTGGGYLLPVFGFDAGFDQYSCVDPLLSDEDYFWSERPVSRQRDFNLAHRQHHDFDNVLEWIRDRRDAPFFLFLHTFLVHNYLPDREQHAAFHAGPYENNHDFLKWKGDKRRDARTMPPELLQAGLDSYDAGLRQADEAVGELIRFLQELRLWQDTLLIVTSDHGEEFLEHGRLGHGRTLHEEQLHVPLLIHLPGNQPPQVVDEPVSLVDLFPTVLDAVGLEPPSLLHGRSLVADHEEEDPTRELVFAELDQTPDNRWRSAVTRSWKSLEQLPDPAGSHQGLRALFDRSVDPRESWNRALEHPQVLESLSKQAREILERAAEARQALGTAGDVGDLDEETLRALRALGYGVK